MTDTLRPTSPDRQHQHQHRKGESKKHISFDVQEMAHSAKLKTAGLIVWIICGTSIVVLFATVTVGGYFLLSEMQEQNDLQLQATQENQALAEDIKGLVDFRDDITSPESTAASQATLAATLQVVLQNADCNTRASLQDTIRGLEQEGLIRPGVVNVQCTEPPPPVPGSAEG